MDLARELKEQTTPGADEGICAQRGFHRAGYCRRPYGIRDLGYFDR